jgi:hypothetical protein
VLRPRGSHVLRRQQPCKQLVTHVADAYMREGYDQAQVAGPHFLGATTSIVACMCRCAFHWDNINEARLLVIRPAAPGWPWSGAFPLPEREDYFGLRLRNRCGKC